MKQGRETLNEQAQEFQTKQGLINKARGAWEEQQQKLNNAQSRFNDGWADVIGKWGKFCEALAKPP